MRKKEERTTRYPPLQEAIINRRLDQVQRVLVTGIDPNGRSPDGVTPLQLAIAVGQKDRVGLAMVQALIKAKADLNAIGSKNQTPLTEALSLGATDVVRALLDAGASPGQQDGNGDSPIMIALKEHQTPFVDEFLEKKAGIDVVNKEGDTPLFIALRNGETGAAGKLALAKVRVDTVNNDGMSPQW